MATVELLKGIAHTGKANRILKFMERAIVDAGDSITLSKQYQGKSDWLVLYGVGAAPHHQAREAQRSRGHSLLLDLGYTDREWTYRFSVDDDHPHRLMDKTPDAGNPISKLKDSFNEAGPIILVGMGKKSKRYLGDGWEAHQMSLLRKEFPDRKIVLKRKDDPTPFESLLQGASLVVARHSNCCVDAAIHNIPFRCEDGAAYWLKDLRDREIFLRKLSYWQCTTNEVDRAWKFAKWVVL